jgi:hypothetical protein
MAGLVGIPTGKCGVPAPAISFRKAPCALIEIAGYKPGDDEEIN